MDISRRAVLAGGLALAAGLISRPVAAAKPAVIVYKSATCGCCKLWGTHLMDNGVPTTGEDVADLGSVKKKHGVPEALQSCHTALVDGYVVEGHVPADLIDRLLAERPQVVGIAVPGMPIGSPGMEMPGRAADRYQILTFDRTGRTTVFAIR
ncbi:MAG: DUF411 domain-containing protein [Candidatus Rokuibacteriota bacterium]|nr:MAG: DUF411 domain-containing protein [Candidatus Rokubacteria bacterium]